MPKLIVYSSPDETLVFPAESEEALIKEWFSEGRYLGRNRNDYDRRETGSPVQITARLQTR
jgi:hypothetical protein